MVVSNHDRAFIDIKSVRIEVPTAFVTLGDGNGMIVTAAEYRMPLEGEIEWLVRCYEQTGVCFHGAGYDTGSPICTTIRCYVCGELIACEM